VKAPKERELGQKEQPPQQRVKTVVPVEHREVPVEVVGIEKKMTRAVAQAKAPANKPQATPA
jgi:hypothetical protein